MKRLQILIGRRIPQRHACLLMLLLLFTSHTWAQGQAGTHPRVLGHYVRLVGKELDTPTSGLPFLRYLQRRCTDKSKFSKQPVVREPTGGWPKHSAEETTEMYYTRTRSLTIIRRESHGIAENCDLKKRVSQRWKLSSSAGGCFVELPKKLKWGQCDEDAHRRANGQHPLSPGHHTVKRGPEMTIAGHRCTVYFWRNHSECLAEPPSEFPISNAPMQMQKSGLQLMLRNKIVESFADTVLLHTEFPEHVFALPKDKDIRYLDGTQNVGRKTEGSR